MKVYNYIISKICDNYSTEEANTLAKVTIAHLCKIPYQNVNTTIEIPGEDDLNLLNNIVDRLNKNEPIQYILNEAPFYGLNLYVNKDTLIPRPETEELVDWFIQNHKGAKASVVDFGSGSGCIALAIKKYCPAITVYGIDKSVAALKVARKNAEDHSLNVNWVEDDILDLKFDATVDCIISNPPYIHLKEAALMEENVLKYEPEMALFVHQNDTIIFYRKIIEFAAKHLNTGGEIYFEINPIYVDEILVTLNNYGFNGIEVKNDIQGKKRFIKAFRIC